jgi:hypothetical protein
MATPKIVVAHLRGYTPGSFGPTRPRRLNQIRIISFGIADKPQLKQGNTWDRHV